MVAAVVLSNFSLKCQVVIVDVSVEGMFVVIAAVVFVLLSVCSACQVGQNMSKFSPPENFRFDQPATWPEWRERFGRFRLATKLHKEDGEVQVSSLIYAMGRQAEHIYKTFDYTDIASMTDPPADPKNDYDCVMKKFDSYFVPKRNVIFQRTQFYQRSQLPGENMETFVRNLRELLEHCGFGAKEDEYVCDRIVSGMLDKELALKLQLDQDNLTLIKVIESARMKEMVKSQVSVDVSHVTKPGRGKQHNTPPQSHASNHRSQSGRQSGRQSGQKCPRCNCAQVS